MVEPSAFDLRARRQTTKVAANLDSLLIKVVPKLEPIMEVKFTYILSWQKNSVNFRKNCFFVIARRSPAAAGRRRSNLVIIPEA